MEYQTRHPGSDRFLVWINAYSVGAIVALLGSVWGLASYLVTGAPSVAGVAVLALAITIGLLVAARLYALEHVERSCAKCRRTFSRHREPGSATHLCSWCFGRIRS
ncbi:MAG: hypothetical protein HY329_11930 [Chloroflexi bacterium]|nr:hypothetical protein [Chloroflexota bacterium]